VLAHELATIHNRDVTVETPLVVISAMVIETSRIGGWLDRTLLVSFGPIAAAFLHLMRGQRLRLLDPEWREKLRAA
jgi:hypothetical protein